VKRLRTLSVGLLGLTLGCGSEGGDDTATSATSTSSSTTSTAETTTTDATTSVSSGPGGAGGAGGVGGGSSSSSGQGGFMGEVGDNLVQVATDLVPGGPMGPVEIEIVDVQIAGPYVVQCAGQVGLRVNDRDDPALPNLSESDLGGTKRCQHVASDGARALVSNRAGNAESPAPHVTLFDITVPGLAVELARLDLPDQSAENVELVAPDLYAVALGEDGLAIVDAAGDDLAIVATLGGFTRASGLAASGDLLYVADSEGGVAVVDLALPDAPALLGHVALPSPARALRAGGGLLLVASGIDGFHVLDVGDPDAPALVASVDTPGSAQQIAYADGHAFVADWNDLRIYDLTVPSSPRLVGTERMDEELDFGRVLGVAAEGDEVYIGDWSALYRYQFNKNLGGPDIRVTALAALAPSAAVGASSTWSVAVYNDGVLPLAVAAEIVDGPFAVAPPSLSLAPGERSAIDVTFTPVDALPVSGTLRLTSDDPDEPLVDVDLLGNPKQLVPGQPAPQWTWPDPFGGPDLTRQSLLGDVVVLSYFASFDSVTSMVALDLEHGVARPCAAEGVTVVGLAVTGFPSGADDTAESLAALRDQAGLTFPIVLDPNQQSYMSWGPSTNVGPFPVLVVLDRDGVVRYASRELVGHEPLDAVNAWK
jgi:peroxiredoxin